MLLQLPGLLAALLQALLQLRQPCLCCSLRLLPRTKVGLQPGAQESVTSLSQALILLQLLHQLPGLLKVQLCRFCLCCSHH